MPGLLDQRPLDLRAAEDRLSELATRGRQLLGIGLLLSVLCALMVAASPSGPGVPVGLGAVAAFALAGLARSDRRRMLVRLVAQGDALTIGAVRAHADQLATPRERGRLARGLRLAVRSLEPNARIQLMVDAARVDDFAHRLIWLAEAVADRRARFSPQALALCGQLLHDPMRSPLCNPHVPERELARVLDLVEQGCTWPSPVSAAPAAGAYAR
ncbi:MAG: hypothetical protein M0T77_08665 [Actinomycetota bacterium]|nr:hypothetical protein [Actinomycetota bacterium]